MVGTALKKILPHAIYLSSSGCDLRSSSQTINTFREHHPTNVIHLAGAVGGIKANMDNMADFYRDNILINTNVLEACRVCGVEKAISVLSTCVYPDKVRYPLTENQIHAGAPHHSNYAYAYAKRMLDVQSRAYRDQYGCNFITVVPNNLFGENDNFDLEKSHVIPAIIRKIYEARIKKKNVSLWGDGSNLREFTYSGDMVKILLFLLESYNERDPINVGNVGEISIKQVSEMVAENLKFEGEILWDISKPPGQHRKPSTNSKLVDLGWSKQQYTPFEEALYSTCRWFEENYPNIRGA